MLLLNPFFFGGVAKENSIKLAGRGKKKEEVIPKRLDDWIAVVS